jgi:hypothetical protein
MTGAHRPARRLGLTRVPLPAPAPRVARCAAPPPFGPLGALALLAALGIFAAGCAQGPQPQPVARKSGGGPAAGVAGAGSPAAAAAGTSAAGSPAGAAAGSPAAGDAAKAAPGTPAQAPAVGGSAALAGAGEAAAVGTSAAAGAAPTGLANPGAGAPPGSLEASRSENARTVADIKQSAAASSGAGKPVTPDPGMTGAPPTGTQGKATVPGKLEHPEHVVVIDDGTSDAVKPKTLVEVARAEKARRAQAGRPAIVITDKSLHKYAKGTLTVVAPKKSTAPAAATAATAAKPSEHDEQFWRRGALDIRLRMKRATEQVKELEQSASDWRRRFYAQDDPYVRDGQIKPAWDRVLEELRQAKTEVDVSRRELQDFLDLGRREGALPGWLREGIELEPPPPPKPANNKSLEAIEPPVMKEPPILNDPPAVSGSRERGSGS